MIDVTPGLKRAHSGLVAAGSVLALTAAPAFGDNTSFLGLGDLPDGQSSREAFDMSADGSVVVGIGESQGFMWSEDKGSQFVGGSPGLATPDPIEDVGAVSADGSVVVGRRDVVGQGFEAARWTESGGVEGLGDLSDGAPESTAIDVSDDGSVVVGHGNFSDSQEAFRWKRSGGMEGLGGLPGGFFARSAVGVSADGSVVVGSGNSDEGWQPYRWTNSGGLEPLGGLPGGELDGIAWGVSADGSVIVGQAESGRAQAEAFRWTERGGMQNLNELPSDVIGLSAKDVSADGSVIVGIGVDDGFIWSEPFGMQSIEDLLGPALPADWAVNQANAVAVSGDTVTVAGRALNPSDEHEAFRAQLPRQAVIPTPSAGSVMLLGLAGLGLVRRRRSSAV